MPFKWLKRLLPGRKKQEDEKLLFAAAVKNKYISSKNPLYYSPEFIFHKYKIKEKSYYQRDVYQKETKGFLIIKESFHKELKELRQLIKQEDRLTIKQSDNKPVLGFEQFYRFINSLSYSNWSRLQDTIKEKYISYPSVIPSVFHNDVKKRYIHNEAGRIYQAKTIFVMKKSGRPQVDTVREVTRDEFLLLQQEVKKGIIKIEKINERIMQKEAVAADTRMVHQTLPQDALSGQGTVINVTDLKRISKYVINDLLENISLERMRRGM